MRTNIYLTFAFVILLGCDGNEIASISALSSNLESYSEGGVRIEGLHVQRSRSTEYISTSRLLDFITIEDESGRIDVWYDTVRMRCPPRMGARVSADGKTKAITLLDTETGEAEPRQAFIAARFSVDDEPPLAAGEVRLCSLSLQEQQMLAMDGPEALRELWSVTGKQVRTVVYD